MASLFDGNPGPDGRQPDPSRPAVVLDAVSVTYEVRGGPADSLRSWLFGRGQSRDRVEHEALREVGVTIPQGASLGVIGSNGSGKTTFLRLIARVLKPTSGRVRVRGRVAPLLDLVGGFHPDLSGRDNIVLNGTLLGLRRQEVLARLDAIVDFAEIGAFIDAPLRTYSAGMVLRVGFAVATDIEPDVLVIDEVLGVGDEHFQRKCAARIDGLRARGATFVLVSHDLHSVERLCPRVLWLDRGRIRMIGPAADVIAAYLAESES
jgi:lipopolysaccharide transport system ATP-binding protein